MRACVLNGTKMACYDTIKGHVVEATGWTRKDPRCQFTAAAGAGFFMTCTVAPFDMLRTRLMNQPTDKKSEFRLSTFLTCLHLFTVYCRFCGVEVRTVGPLSPRNAPTCTYLPLNFTHHAPRTTHHAPRIMHHAPCRFSLQRLCRRYREDLSQRGPRGVLSGLSADLGPLRSAGDPPAHHLREDPRRRGLLVVMSRYEPA
mmetsp:Transcript_6287/g.15869  ORF Transcript_6287/g.15869 Transcript_6287/m.15869 type:complete len:200 (+) Transcript_6287:143-742(+)